MKDIALTLRTLIKKGKECGYVTYTVMNDALPDDQVSPEGIDGILMGLEEAGIKIVDKEHAKKSAHGEHAKKAPAKKPVAKKVDAKTGATPPVLKQYAAMEKARLAKLTQLLKRIQNIARQEKSEKTVAAIDNAIKRETEAAKKRFAQKAAAIKKQQAKPAAKRAPAKKREARKK